jgi:hypothetical protein
MIITKAIVSAIGEIKGRKKWKNILQE